jgi:hypothetical protein
MSELAQAATLTDEASKLAEESMRVRLVCSRVSATIDRVLEQLYERTER